MEITLDKLLEGKATIIKDREFKATKEYVQPFIDEINKYAEKLIIQAQQPDQIIITDNKATTYNKVWIQGLLPNVIDNKQETINFVYSLDNRVPVYKVFRSYKDKDSGNLYSCNELWIKTFEIKDDERMIIPIKTLLETNNPIEKVIDDLSNTTILDRNATLGKLIDKTMLSTFSSIAGKVKLSTSSIIKAYENLYFDSTSKYYSTTQCSMLDFYDSINQLITEDKKDIFNKFEKSHLVYLICK